MASATIEYLIRGRVFDLCEIVVNGRHYVRDFITEELSKEEQRKIVALFERTAEQGIPHNDQKFKCLRDGIFEFKSFQTRIFCAFHVNRIILLTHGCKKKKDKTDQQEIERALRLLKEAGYGER